MMFQIHTIVHFTRKISQNAFRMFIQFVLYHVLSKHETLSTVYRDRCPHTQWNTDYIAPVRIKNKKMANQTEFPDDFLRHHQNKLCGDMIKQTINFSSSTELTYLIYLAYKNQLF